MKMIQEFSDGHNTIMLQYSPNGIYVNLTALGKSFNTNPYDFILQPIAQELIDLIKSKVNSHVAIIRTDKSSGEPCVWAIQEFALVFANWQNPIIEIIVRKCIKEFLLTPITKISGNTRPIGQIGAELHELVMESNYDRLLRYEDDEILAKGLARLAFEKEYKDKQGNLLGFIQTEDIASILGLTAETVMDILKKKGVLYPTCTTTYLLAKQYSNKNYTTTSMEVSQNSFGESEANVYTGWTDEGEKFVTDLLWMDKEVTQLRVKDKKAITKTA